MELHYIDPVTGESKTLSLDGGGGRFTGKSLLVIGDSVMAFTGIPEKIAEISGMNVTNSAVGGTRAGWHVYENYDALSFYRLADAIVAGDFSNQLTQAETIGNKALFPMRRLAATDFSKLDYMYVSFGTNDFSGGNNLDAQTGADPERFHSYRYALEYGLQQIQSKYPHIKIMLGSPIFRGDYGDYAGGFSDGYIDKHNRKLREYVTCEQEVGAKAHVPVANMYDGAQINRDTYKYYLQFSPEDYVHPNKEVGAPMLASRIYGQMLANW